MLNIQPFPYYPNSAVIGQSLRHLPGFIWLDSGRPNSLHGRYDIITVLPYATLVTTDGHTSLQIHQQTQFSTTPAFELLKMLLSETSTIEDHSLPFVGGAIGYFSYDLARQLEQLPSIAQQDPLIPEMMLGIYDWAIIVDHQEQCSWFVEQSPRKLSAAQCQQIKQCLANLVDFIQPGEDYCIVSPFSINLEYAAYAQAFQRVQDYISAGDCYELNLTRRWQAPISGCPWSAYLALRRCSSTPFSAFLDYAALTVLSLSPERFLYVHNHQVETKPIKGTRPRSADPAQDLLNAQELAHSEKDQAENLMIVDLMRNDLSKSCQPGSVKVPKLFAIESFPTVHHLVSTITGRLAPEKHSIDLLRDCFPGGSITGAPKIRAMEIIEELEPHRRGIYCGSIGYISQNGNMDTNIAIRTLTWHRDQIYAAAGGAIVADSKVESEFQETIDKIQPLLRTLQTKHCAYV